jgi:hypothetical protein
MKISSVEEDECFTLVINSSAFVLFRPLKKIFAGFLAASKEMAPAPSPFVPERQGYYIIALYP